jgi:hypothetical protein
MSTSHIDICSATFRSLRLGTLAVLGDDLLVQLLAFLEPVSLQQTGSTCLALRPFACHDVFWSFFTLNQFGAPSRHLGDWRATYIQSRFTHSLLKMLPGSVPAIRDSEFCERSVVSCKGLITDGFSPSHAGYSSGAMLPLHRSARAILHAKLLVRSVTSQMLYEDYLVRHSVLEHFEPLFPPVVPSIHDPVCFPAPTSAFDASWLAVMASQQPHIASISFPAMVPYVAAADLSQQVFQNHFEKHTMPFVCSDAVSDWPALSSWNPDALAKLCGDAKLSLSHRVGELYSQNPKV